MTATEPGTDTPLPPSQSFDLLPLDSLRESATNPRKTFREQDMIELVQSVVEHGVLQPILVRPIESMDGLLDAVQALGGACFEIVAGARRFRAAGRAGLTVIPAMIAGMSDKQALEVQLVENLQRADLHPLEEGRGYKLLLDRHGYTVDQIKLQTHKSRAYIYGRLKLCDLPEAVATMFEAGELDASCALLVARIPNAEQALKAAQEIAWGFYYFNQTPEGRRNMKRSPMSFREATDLVRNKYMLRLSDVAWDTSDETLSPGAGSCGACPKRTGNARDLFGDLDGADRDDLCTDGGCFQMKAAAHWSRRGAEVLAAGGRVVDRDDEQATLEAMTSTVRLDQVYLGDDKRRTYGKLLGKAVKDLSPVLYHDDNLGEMVEGYDRKQVLKILGTLGYDVDPVVTKDLDPEAAAAKKARDDSHRRRVKAADLARPEILKAAGKLPEARLLRFVIVSLGAGHAGSQILKQAGLATDSTGLTPAGRKDLERVALARLRSLVVELLAGDEVSNAYAGAYTKAWLDACTLCGVAMKAFEKLVPLAGEKTKAAAPQKAKAKRGRKK